MAGWGHLYVTAHGEGTGAWAGEDAQVGLRILHRPLASSNGPIVEVPDLGPVVQKYNDFTSGAFSVVQTFDLNFPGVPIDASQYMVDIAEDFRQWMSNIKTYQGNLFRWTHIKIAPIEKGTGKYLAGGSTYTLTAPIVGTGTTTLPPEVSVAQSMRAAIVGRRGRGRMYLPFPASSVSDSSGILGGVAQTGMATQLKTLLTNLENQAGFDTMKVNVVVMSAASETAVIPSEVRIGNHFDAQRRRQHQVDESYSSLPL